MIAVRCKTCGTPLGEVPFEPCPEHAVHERLVQMFQNLLDGLESDLAKRQEEFDPADWEVDW